MRKILNDKYSLFYQRFFPYKKRVRKNYKNIVTLGIGGNIGNTKRRLKKLFLYLKTHPQIIIIQTSPILKNPAFGYEKQDDFYNAIIKVSTKMSAKELLKFTQHTEKIFGRVRSFQNAPRTLDIDIIFFNNDKVNKANLIIPHPCWHQRDSILIPLSCYSLDLIKKNGYIRI